MIESLQRLFQDMMAVGEPPEKGEPTLALATAVLLCEVARADYHLDDRELARLREVLGQRFVLDLSALDALLAQAREEVDTAVDHHRFVSSVREHCDYNERFELVRLMWSLALVDGHKDPLEEHRIRRLAELLHVSHGDFIRAKLAEEGASPG
ncbi:TerB family tellurite resistance protein [Halomonas nitroreducens]|uniref:TerB family tellurite resistance protein n=1 Tax=Halomonas nitroreducens TaxID=447425 RepID=A0A3S0JV77_9GAMM|nr:TerB family tellurite resistance protein [Halomonas nitroreducens]RTQ98709.1 TerB family tellurite resistance protein [Halomonas nitroreducens]